MERAYPDKGSQKKNSLTRSDPLSRQTKLLLDKAS